MGIGLEIFIFSDMSEKTFCLATYFFNGFHHNSSFERLLNLVVMFFAVRRLTTIRHLPVGFSVERTHVTEEIGIVLQLNIHQPFSLNIVEFQPGFAS